VDRQFSFLFPFYFTNRFWRIRKVISKIKILSVTFHDEKQWREISNSEVSPFIFLPRTRYSILFLAQRKLLLRTYPRTCAWCTFRMMKKWSVYFYRAKAKHIADTSENMRNFCKFVREFCLALNSSFSLYARIQSPGIFFSLVYSTSRFYPARALMISFLPLPSL